MSDTTVLLLSMRSLADLVASCSLYEFEDVIQSVTGADRVEATHRATLEFSRRAYKYARRYTGSRSLASHLAPSPHIIRLNRDYDLFFPVFNHPHELYALAEVPGWRKHCRVAACYILEAWLHLLPGYLLELLAEFDCVFTGCYNVTGEISRLIGKPCVYLPAGVDVLNFSPYPEQPPRVIDVCNIGRRSPATHESLLTLGRQRRAFFYYFDTVAASGIDLKQRTFHVDNPAEHRMLYGSILQRSRYYIANRARANEPHFTAHGDEISNRFYEGAAAGTVMLGEQPRAEEFKRQFDWPDAVIGLDFNAPEIGSVIAELDRDPDRLARIRRDNVYHAALRHDWVYRIHQVFDTLHLAPTKCMLAREQQLDAIAAMTRTPNVHEQDDQPTEPSAPLDNILIKSVLECRSKSILEPAP